MVLSVHYDKDGQNTSDRYLMIHFIIKPSWRCRMLLWSVSVWKWNDFEKLLIVQIYFLGRLKVWIGQKIIRNTITCWLPAWAGRGRETTWWQNQIIMFLLKKEIDVVLRVRTRNWEWKILPVKRTNCDEWKYRYLNKNTGISCLKCDIAEALLKIVNRNTICTDLFWLKFRYRV